MHRRDISAATRKRAQPSPQHVGTRTTTPQGSAQREGGTSRRKTMRERTQLAKRNRQRRANAPHRNPTGPNRSAASPTHPGSFNEPVTPRGTVASTRTGHGERSTRAQPGGSPFATRAEKPTRTWTQPDTGQDTTPNAARQHRTQQGAQ